MVIAESTRKLLGNLFDLQGLGTQELKGIGSLARTWAVLRPASVESRFEALHASGLTELVGREEELEILLRRWSRAKTGEGQVVLLSGEAGIGKSRLTAALLEHLASEPYTRLRYFCSPQHTDSALKDHHHTVTSGLMYDEGKGVPRDYAEAVKWYRRSAEQGNARAQHNLGGMYFNGRGVPQDHAEAVKWRRRAAEQGFAEAQMGLGAMYNLGRGVPQDYAEGVKWSRRAADQGNARAQTSLGGATTRATASLRTT